MTALELSRPIKPRQLPGDIRIEANEAERAALATRFGISAVHALGADLVFSKDGSAVVAEGRLAAEVEQPCAISGEDFRYNIDEPLSLRFVPAAGGAETRFDEEIELDAEDLDEIEYDGDAFDLGEAVAQSLGLAIDPYAEGPAADEARKAGLVSSPESAGSFASLAALKPKD